MHADRVVDALRRFVFEPTEQVDKRQDEPGSLSLRTARDTYLVRPADWRIASAGWVADAVRVVVPRAMENFSLTYGLVFPADGDVLFLNDMATMKDLGRRLGVDLEPLAYAELLAELYSVRSLDVPVVYPFAATESFRPGWLVEDVAELCRRYPSVDPSLAAAPQAVVDGTGTVLRFHSHNYYLLEFGAAIDLYRWVVTAAPGRPAEWFRETAVRGLEIPV